MGESQDFDQGAAEVLGPYAFEPSPEDFLPAPPKPPGPFSYWPSSKYLRPAALCLALFLFASSAYWNTPQGSLLPVSGEAIFQHHEYWRLVTALLTHADVFHIIANTWLFLLFGWLLRAYFGFWVFPVLSFVIGALANLVTVYFYPPEVQLIGASGMVYGMVALWVVLFVRFDTADPALTVRIVKAVGFALLMLFPTTYEKSTSYMAHAWGFAFGFGLALAFMPLVRLSVPAANVPTETRRTLAYAPVWRPGQQPSGSRGRLPPELYTGLEIRAGTISDSRPGTNKD